MSRSFAKLIAAVLALAACGFSLPAAAGAQGAGGTTAPSPAPGPPPAGGAPPAVASAPGQPVLDPSPGALLGRSVELRGSVHSSDTGKPVSVQRQDEATGWIEIAQATAGGDGAFEVAWRADLDGRVSLRAVLVGAGASAAQAPPAIEMTVYKPSVASWYGPGFYGRRTACGQRLTRQMLGVAHRTLPCGTQVELFYGGRTVTVPVIDRGPFANGASWDLTGATAQALGFKGVARVGAAVVGSGP